MKSNEFKCDMCLKIYLKGWGEKEKFAEMREIWGEIPPEERATLCNDCFNRRTPKEVKEMGDEYKNKDGR